MDLFIIHVDKRSQIKKLINILKKKVKKKKKKNEPILTSGGEIKERIPYIIHVVGPNYKESGKQEVWNKLKR